MRPTTNKGLPPDDAKARPDASPDGSPPTGDAIARLWAALDNHVKLRAPVPDRTARLVSAGEPKMAQKVVEEAGEVAVAAMLKDRTEVIRESADLVYHLTILWVALDIRPEQVWAEMAARESAYGLAEKRAKPASELKTLP
jgi:phosphoribosyl-ATP pyrophosphohydrolase